MITLVLAGALALAPLAPAGNSVTTLDGPSYSWRYVPVDIDQAPGPWRHGSGHRRVFPTDGGRAVEVRGHGTCTTVLDGEVMDHGTDCGAWVNLDDQPGGLGGYVDRLGPR